MIRIGIVIEIEIVVDIEITIRIGIEVGAWGVCSHSGKCSAEELGADVSVRG